MDPFRVEVHCPCGLRYRAFGHVLDGVPGSVTLQCPDCRESLSRETLGTVEIESLVYTALGRTR